MGYMTSKDAVPTPIRILRNSEADLTTKCWNWILKIDKDGYGQIKMGSRTLNNRRTKHAHRVSYEAFIGAIPVGMTIDHLCRNRKCVNPVHLEVVTIRENTLRGTGCSANNATKTHCPKGHELSGINLTPAYLKRGKRVCLICSRAQAAENQRRYRRERRERG